MGIIKDLQNIIKDADITMCQNEIADAGQTIAEVNKQIKQIKSQLRDNPVQALKIGLQLLKLNNKKRWAIRAEGFYKQRLERIQSPEKFIKNEFDLSDIKKPNKSKEKSQRASEGAVHNGLPKVDYKSAKIVNKNSGKTVVEYEHYNEVSRCAEIDLKKPTARGFFDPQKGLTLVTIDSISVKLGKDNRIDWSLPENAEILKFPEAVAEVLERYPESYKTMPPAAIAHSKQTRQKYIKAVHTGYKNKIAAGEIPPHEDGTEKTEDEYKRECVDMVKDRYEKANEYIAEMQKKQQANAGNNKEFDDLENTYA